MNDSRYRFWYSSPEHLRLSIGRFLGELLDMMEQRALGNGGSNFSYAVRWFCLVVVLSHPLTHLLCLGGHCSRLWNSTWPILCP